MDSLLNEFITGFLFVYLMVLVRFGTAMLIMPGIGDSFVSPQIRLYFALALSLVVAPMLAGKVTAQPTSALALAALIFGEAFIGFFIGIVARCLLSILSIAGMMISMQIGLASAQIFNPTMEGQGSIFGAFLSVMGVVLLFVTNLHHLILMAIFNSYELFPFGQFPEMGDIADTMTRLVSYSFMIGIQLSAPFVIVSFMIYLALGVMARLMPQMQVFFIVLPIQILSGLFIVVITITTLVNYWLGAFETNLIGFLGH